MLSLTTINPVSPAQKATNDCLPLLALVQMGQRCSQKSGLKKGLEDMDDHLLIAE